MRIKCGTTIILFFLFLLVISGISPVAANNMLLSTQQTYTSHSPQATTVSIDWNQYWHIHDWHLAYFKNYIFNGSQWVDTSFQTVYGIAPQTSLRDTEYMTNIYPWRLQFAHGSECPQCYYSGSNLRFYVAQVPDKNGQATFSAVGFTTTPTSLWNEYFDPQRYPGVTWDARKGNDGLGLYAEGVHDPQIQEYLTNVTRFQSSSTSSHRAYILSPAGTTVTTTSGCSNLDWFWNTGTYNQSYYGIWSPPVTEVQRSGFTNGGNSKITDATWNAKACWLGPYQVGPYYGNVVNLQFNETYYASWLGRNTTIVETWALMQGVGLVQVANTVDGIPQNLLTISSHNQ